MALGTHLVLNYGGLNIFAQQSGGAKGTRLKSSGPYKTWYADSLGCVREVLSIFNVSCAFFIRFHHSIEGNLSSHVLRPAIVLFLNVFIARSDAFTRWFCGSNSCILVFSYYKYFFTVFEATLSMILKTDLKPLLLST